MIRSGKNSGKPDRWLPCDEHSFLAVLGASNVWLALPELAAHVAHRARDEQVHLHVASGPGRSWGDACGIPGVRWPALSDPRIYDALARRIETLAPARRHALLTDVGNDIAYGAPEGEIVAWVELSLTRLRGLGFEVALTGLPLSAIERLSSHRFELVRRALFPGKRLRLDTVIESAQAVHDGLSALARKHELTLFETEPSWYGFDPIHPRRPLRRQIFAAWIDRLRHGCALPLPALSSRPGRRFARLRTHPPARWHVLGRERRRAQPGVSIDDRVSFYAY